MDVEYIIITYGNCNNAIQPKKIALNTNNIDEWDLKKIKSYQIDPTSISSITVGPRTVLQFFYGDSFTGQSHTVINEKKDEVRVYTFFDCPKTGNKWAVSLNSFKIWTFDHYDSIYGTRFCDSDKNCDANELCMCDTGKVNPLWCPQSKKRCMNEKYYYDKSEIPINDEDIIKTNCLVNQLTMENISFDELKRKFRPCMVNKLKTIEKFSGNEYFLSSFSLLRLFLCIIILVAIYFMVKRLI